MIKCEKCGGWLVEETDTMPEPDTYSYELKDGVKVPVIHTKYPEGFCSCDEGCNDAECSCDYCIEKYLREYGEDYITISLNTNNYINK